jgi:hypothetical protein
VPAASTRDGCSINAGIAGLFIDKSTCSDTTIHQSDF